MIMSIFKEFVCCIVAGLLVAFIPNGQKQLFDTTFLDTNTYSEIKLCTENDDTKNER